MKFYRMLGMGLAFAMSSAVYAADGDAKPDGKVDVKGVRLTKPFSDLKDLTPDQTTRIKEIHKKYLTEIKALEAKQKDEEMAVLTEAQKKEIATMPVGDKKKPAGAAADKGGPKPESKKADAPAPDAK